MAKVTVSTEIRELETHLSERIATYAETSLEMSMTHRDSVDSLNESIDGMKMIIEEAITHQKNNLAAARIDFDAKVE